MCLKKVQREGIINMSKLAVCRAEERDIKETEHEKEEALREIQ